MQVGMVGAGRMGAGLVRRLMRVGRACVVFDRDCYRDDPRHAGFLALRGIRLVDCGTSGGIWGLAGEYCLMLGGDAAVVERLRPILAALAPRGGCRPPHPGPRRPGRAVRAGLGALLSSSSPDANSPA